MSRHTGRHRIMGSSQKGTLVMTVLEADECNLDRHIGIANRVEVMFRASDDLNWRSYCVEKEKFTEKSVEILVVRRRSPRSRSLAPSALEPAIAACTVPDRFMFFEKTIKYKSRKLLRISTSSKLPCTVLFLATAPLNYLIAYKSTTLPLPSQLPDSLTPPIQ